MKSRSDDAGPGRPAGRTALTGLLALFLALHGLADIFVIFAAKRELVEGLTPPGVFEYVLTGFEAAVKLLASALLWEFSPFGYMLTAGYCLYAILSGTVSVLAAPPRFPLLLWSLGTLYYSFVLQALDSKPIRESLLGVGAVSPRTVAVAKWALFAAGTAAYAWHRFASG